MARTLNDLKDGASAKILQVTGDDAVSLRLMEMGVLEGELIRRVGSAPMGDPIEFALHGYRLTLRVSEATRIEIEE